MNAWLSLVTALLVLAGVAVPLYREMRKNTKATEVVVAQVAQVHTLVNQQHTDMVAYQALLVASLRAGGIEVPRDQSLDDLT